MIRVELNYSCGGCHKSQRVKDWIAREFRSFSGRDHGFGTHVFTTDMSALVQKTCPEGWIAFDPYTSCTYCPECWKEIEDGIAETAAHEGERDGE